MVFGWLRGNPNFEAVSYTVMICVDTMQRPGVTQAAQSIPQHTGRIRLQTANDFHDRC